MSACLRYYVLHHNQESTMHKAHAIYDSNKRETSKLMPLY